MCKKCKELKALGFCKILLSVEEVNLLKKHRDADNPDYDFFQNILSPNVAQLPDVPTVNVKGFFNKITVK